MNAPQQPVPGSRRAARSGAKASTRRRATSRARGPRVTPIRDLIFFVLLMAVCALPLWPLYATWYVAVTVGGALVAGLLVSMLTGMGKAPWYLVTVIAVGVGLLVGVPLAVPSGTVSGFIPTLDGLGTFVSGLVRSWVDIISVDPPLGSYDAVLVPVFVIVYVGSFLAWRGIRSGRRWPAIVAAATLLVFGIVFGARTGFRPAAVGVAALVVGLVWVVAIRPGVQGIDAAHTRKLRGGQIRRTVAALVFAAICAGVGGYAAQSVALKDREVLRTAFEPDYQVQRHISPLQEYRSFVTGTGKEKQVATVTGLGGQALRVAVMDEYNGVDMEVGNGGSSGTFTRLPAGVFSAGEAPAAEQELTVGVTLKQPPGEWLPLAGALRSFDVSTQVRDKLYYNRSLDAAVVSGGMPAGSNYTVHSVQAPAPLRGGLDALTPGKAHQADLVQVPERLIEAARVSWSKQTVPGAQLQAALSYLLAGGVSHGEGDEVFSRSGHSAERLNLLAEEEPMVGDAEQYSVAMYVLAREIGFPARVVMGYTDQNHDGVLTGSELTAWVEVQDASQGWVGIDPNPTPREIKKQQKSSEDAIALPRSVLPPDVPRQDDTVTPKMDESLQQPPVEPPAWLVTLLAVWWWTWRIGLALLLLTSPLWVLALIEALRRRVRRRADRKGLSVSGGWSEVRDEAIDRGIPVAWADTRLEVASGTGNERVALLARRADELSFAPRGPQRSDVDAYWKDVRSARRELRRGRTGWQRFRQRYSWRSLSRWVKETFKGA